MVRAKQIPLPWVVTQANFIIKNELNQQKKPSLQKRWLYFLMLPGL
jgi:hypothetical protein